MISKEQKRSAFALQHLQKHGQINKDLANFIVGTPTMILQNGFGQAMAFLLSKGNGKKKDEKHNFVFNTICAWSGKENNKISEDKNTFFNTVAGLSQEEYLNLQEEALKLLQWLKRYARAFQEESKEKES